MTHPQPEVPKFSGDPTEYHTFMMAFDARIVSRTSSYPDCLYYLNQYTKGKPNNSFLVVYIWTQGLDIYKLDVF